MMMRASDFYGGEQQPRPPLASAAVFSDTNEEALELIMILLIQGICLY